MRQRDPCSSAADGAPRSGQWDLHVAPRYWASQGSEGMEGDGGGQGGATAGAGPGPGGVAGARGGAGRGGPGAGPGHLLWVQSQAPSKAFSS